MKRDELQPIGGVLSLIRDLTGGPMRASSVPELFRESFGALNVCVPFDLAAVVMLEQNLDLHVVARHGAESAVSDRLIERLRARLRSLLAISFDTADASSPPR